MPFPIGAGSPQFLTTLMYRVIVIFRLVRDLDARMF